MTDTERLRAAVREIAETCRVPTPAGLRAYTHFQRDFDKVRMICRQVLEETNGR